MFTQRRHVGDAAQHERQRPTKSCLTQQQSCLTAQINIILHVPLGTPFIAKSKIKRNVIAVIESQGFSFSASSGDANLVYYRITW